MYKDKIMDRTLRVNEILSGGLIAIIRQPESKYVLDIVKAVYNGGIKAIEITSNTPDCFELVEQIAHNWPHMIIGVGTVTSKNIAETAINKGANFLVTPITNKKIVQMAHSQNTPVFMGALTPTEIYKAYEYGADAIKLFPAGQFGIDYMKAVLAPLSDIPVIPTGGVTLDNATTWMMHGAVALGLGNALTDHKLIQNQDFEAITTRANLFVEKINSIKSDL